ncbi:MAG: serine hydroxymethyltransferase [Holosporales bacterium]|jgi:glycine hydroxymethyltransferase|nr:serine hydroxymethyltransferase [Holosporales bacterium]
MTHLSKRDRDAFDIFKQELLRQRGQIELIASENFTSLAVMEAAGSVLTNKYAEGYPAKRYYGGCEVVDKAENLAIARVTKMFGCKYANVQPHSGAQANMAVYFSLLKPGDTILGMSLAAGGHLTHGASPTFSGRWLKAIGYGVSEKTGLIDYDQVRSLAQQHKPKLIVAGASSYPRTIDFKRFREISDEVGAYLLADVAHYAGLVVTGLYPNPFPHAHVVTTTTHKTLRGPRGAVILTDSEDLIGKINSAVFPGIQGGPFMHIILAKAVAFGEALSGEFKQYMTNVLENSKLMAKRLMDNGIGIVSGGTDSHMAVVDLRELGVTGKQAEIALEQCGIACNKNGVPFDPLPPSVTSGLRLGTAAGTTRGFRVKEFDEIAQIISKVLKALAAGNADSVYAEVRSRVSKLCEAFPLYPELSC